MSDARLRAAERAYREDMSAVAEAAYYEAWLRLSGTTRGSVRQGVPPARGVTPPPWHIRCPSGLPRAGDVLAPSTVTRGRRARIVVRYDFGGEVLYLHHGDRFPRAAEPHAWTRWCREGGAVVRLFAGLVVPVDACWNDRLILWAAEKLGPEAVRTPPQREPRARGGRRGLVTWIALNPPSPRDRAARGPVRTDDPASRMGRLP